MTPPPLELPEPPRSICIVMLSAMGDAVHVFPVANALKRHWPETRITWVIQPVPHLLARGHPAIDEFVVFQRRRGIDAWRSYADLRTAFAGRRFDLLLGLQVYFKAGLITALTPARIKLGFDRARARDLNWLFTNRRIPAHPRDHVQDEYFQFLRYLGVDPEPVEWRIPITGSEREAQREFYGSDPRPSVAVVVGTSKPEKNWAPERYARLVAALESDFGFRCVIVGGPSVVERHAAEVIERTSGASPVNELGNDVRRLIYLLDGADLVISPDTGPLHLARALGKPVIGLYGYTNPKRYGPYRKDEDLVVDGYARFHGEAYPPSMEYRREGVQRVTVEMVLEKVQQAVVKYDIGR